MNSSSRMVHNNTLSTNSAMTTTTTELIFDDYYNVVQRSMYSIYTTLFVTCVLVVGTSIVHQHILLYYSLRFSLSFFPLFPHHFASPLLPPPLFSPPFHFFLSSPGTYFFSSDVNKLIINPIERLVDLVRKISDNPLGVEYKMLGEKEGFVAGMETTILLTTINRIGGKCRWRFVPLTYRYSLYPLPIFLPYPFALSPSIVYLNTLYLT